jgi:hypothetical protein
MRYAKIRVVLAIVLEAIAGPSEALRAVEIVKLTHDDMQEDLNRFVALLEVKCLNRILGLVSAASTCNIDAKRLSPLPPRHFVGSSGGC